MKTFLSIGTGPGMGFATAERFAKGGFQLILAARNAAKTEELAAKLRSKGYKAEARTVDAGDPKGVAKLVADVEKQHGSVDVLHYNAASLRKATLTEQPRDTFNGDLAVNIGGALAAAQAVAAGMEAHKSGAILLTGGFLALAPSPDHLSLSIGKAGLRALALGLFEPFREKGIHVATDGRHAGVPGFEGSRRGRRTVLAPVQPAEGCVDRRSAIRSGQRLSGASVYRDRNPEAVGRPPAHGQQAARRMGRAQRNPSSHRV